MFAFVQVLQFEIGQDLPAHGHTYHCAAQVGRGHCIRSHSRKFVRVEVVHQGTVQPSFLHSLKVVSLLHCNFRAMFMFMTRPSFTVASRRCAVVDYDLIS